MAEEIRPLNEAEYNAFFDMSAQAFRPNPNRARRSREWTRVEEIRGIFEDGQLRAGLKVIDAPIWMGESTVGNGAITSVASPPENRRRGYTGRLLHGCLEELRDKGVPVATLYPFSFPFYKHFGWEQVEDKYLYKVPIERFPLHNVGGTWQAVSRSTDFAGGEPALVSGEDLAVLTEIYNRWCEGRTGPLVRDERFWRRGILQQGAEQRPDVYIWRDHQGRPRAYVLYAFKELDNPWVRQLQVWDFAALDHAAFMALLGFLRNHDSQSKEVAMYAPAGFPFMALFEDPEFKVEVEAGFMLRLVDVATALTARRYPAGVSGRVTINVKDSFCEWNNGAYTLEVRDGAGVVQKAMDSHADISLDQKALAQVYTGYLTAKQAESVGLLHASDPAALERAGAIFHAPPPFMPDHF